MAVTAAGVAATFGQTLAIAGKELTELRRQPAVLILVVLGPFLALAAFGLGYRNEELSLRTVFVGPRNGPYEAAIDRYTGGIDDYVVPVAFSADFPAAIEDLRSDRVDLVIVLPPGPAQAIQEGRQSEIAVIHNSIDPIERVGIEFATEVAVRELNATVVAATLDSLLAAGGALDQDVGSFSGQLSAVEGALLLGNGAEAERLASGLSDDLLRFQESVSILDPSDSPRERGGDEPASGSTETGSSLAQRIDRYGRGRQSPEDLQRMQSELAAIDEQLALVLTLDAQILARPFAGDAEGLTRERVTAEAHVAPGATALLIQHLALSLAALSLVRDRRRGVLTDYRVGPVSVIAVMGGKLLSLSLVAASAAAALMAAQYWLLGVPFRGSIVEAALLVLGLVVASVAVGLVVASLGRSELHASQAAMILLLLALFFSGFFLDLDRIVQPFRTIGLVVPATPAVNGLRDIQLRGTGAGTLPFVILGTQAAIGLIVATLVLHRQWRTPQ